MALESVCFAENRRSSRRALRRALVSSGQGVWVIAGEAGDLLGAMILFLYPRALRVYSVAVLPAARGTGAGSRLLGLVLALARRQKKARVTLEADAANGKLLAWYVARGFSVTARLPDYYGPGEDAVRMCFTM